MHKTMNMVFTDGHLETLGACNCDKPMLIEPVTCALVLWFEGGGFALSLLIF